MEPRSNEREMETPATVDPSPAPPISSGIPSGAIIGLAMALGTLIGVLLTAIATGLHAGEIHAFQRQAAAIESIADTLRLSATPVQTPRAVPMVFEDSAGSDICSIVEDGDGGVHIEGEDPAPCERFLWARYGEIDSAPDL